MSQKKYTKRSLDSIVKDGFSLTDRKGKLTDLSLISLRTGLRSYFATYSSMMNFLHLFEPNSTAPLDKADFAHALEYIENSTEAILHLQHFAELVCKDLLRDEHPILASDAANDSVILAKMLSNDALTDDEIDGLKSLEFSSALERLLKLHDSGQLKKNSAIFIKNNQAALKTLNQLRNRLLHRGRYILRYDALDEFIGGHVLSFIKEALKLPRYKDLKFIWKYPQLTCGIDPLDEIEAELRSPTYDLRKVALLKELGRAAYASPLYENLFGQFENMTLSQRAEASASTDEIDAYAVRDCPVCGVKALIMYASTEVDGEPEDETATLIYRHTYEVYCTCCTFSTNSYLNNPKDYGLSIDDLWFEIK
ncbi:hypothetical protein [Corallococcus exiguus]|uniref:hypothetical protein n=1 Tax=Corallococcus exiguus TaxID=83462 RepID=UPI0015603CCB|nr:hypothetical protein [Corallococcus exiguus]NRD51621.1 hypothetical protein [Corallococcus exiguus]